MNRVICSICSREKDSRPGLLPARERYKGSHVTFVEKIAAKSRLRLFFLSGKLGVIDADSCIPVYDYLLAPEGVQSLSYDIWDQLESLGIEEIRFYTKHKPAWEPYLEALRLGAYAAGVKLVVELLPDDA